MRRAIDKSYPRWAKREKVINQNVKSPNPVIELYGNTPAGAQRAVRIGSEVIR